MDIVKAAACIMIFYIILFVVSKALRDRGQIIIYVLLSAAYTVLAARQERLYVIGFLSMLSGYIGFWIGLHIDFPFSFAVNLAVVWSLGTLLYIISEVIMSLYRKTVV